MDAIPGGAEIPCAQTRIVRLARGDDVLDIGLCGRREAGARVGAVDRAEFTDNLALDGLRIRVVTLLVVGSAAVLGGDGEAPPGLGRDVGDESERDNGDEAADDEARPGAARSGATALNRGRIGVQHGPGVVVRPGMVRVRVLGEDDELARIVGPVAQRVKVERAPEGVRRGRGLNTGERIAIPNAPPTLHFASPLSCTGTKGTDGTRSHTGDKASKSRSTTAGDGAKR